VEGVIGFTKKTEAKTDNTLQLLMQRKVVTTANENEKLKEKLLKQQEDARHARESSKSSNNALPPNWESVFDKESKTVYYWNKITNVTSWDIPEPEATSMSSSAEVIEVTDLTIKKPVINGWEEKYHSGTRQVYYLNIRTGEKSATNPADELVGSSGSSKDQIIPAEKGDKKRSSNFPDAAVLMKQQRYAIDPLDPTPVSLVSCVHMDRHLHVYMCMYYCIHIYACVYFNTDTCIFKCVQMNQNR
jgi:hypothetical protein